MPSREQMWEQSPEEVDLVVIGGGITGAGIVRDAARRGLRVVLFEQNDIAASDPDEAIRLRGILERWRIAVDANMPTANPDWNGR